MSNRAELLMNLLRRQREGDITASPIGSEFMGHLSMPDVPDFLQREMQYNARSPDWQYIRNPDGTISSHKMMSFEHNGNQLAAPTIVNQNGRLVELSFRDARKYALRNKEYVIFSTKAAAQGFAEGNWKRENWKSRRDLIK